jgi:predicted aspartyl protease
MGLIKTPNMKSLMARLSSGFLHQGRADVEGMNPIEVDTRSGCPVPFTFDPILQPGIIVQVSVNGHAPLPFWIDTGLSSGLLIDTQTAATLQLTPATDIPATKIGAIRARRTCLDSVALIGATPAESVPLDDPGTVLIGDLAVLRPHSIGEPVAGLLGIQALAGNVVCFDFAAHTMTFSRRQSALPSGMSVSGMAVREQTATGPMGETGDSPAARDSQDRCQDPRPRLQALRKACLPMTQHPGDERYYVQVTLQPGVITELLLDTGAEGTSIPIPVAERLHALGSKPVGMATAYGMSITPMLLLPSLSLGDCTLHNVAVTSLPQMPAGFPLGIDLLARFRVTLDFPQRRLVLENPLERAQQDCQDRQDGYTGIRLIAEGNRFVVAAVDADSPAQRAGIRAGDLVRRIDGQTLDVLPLLTAHRLLNGFADTYARLTLQDAAGAHYVASFVRRSEFARPSLPIDGLCLLIRAHRPMEVIGLLRDSVGAQAGLRQGDIVQEFNGHPTQGITSEILAVEFRMPQLTLKVRRAGVKDPLAFTLTTSQNKSNISADSESVIERE